MSHSPSSRVTNLTVAASLAIASCLVGVVATSGTASAASQIPPGTRRCFAVVGNPGDIAVINLTPVLASATGDGKLLPTGVQPSGPVANVNFGPGTVDPNVAFTRIGDDAGVCFHNSNDASVDLVADQLGTISSKDFTYKVGGYAPGGQPYRVLDTRTSGTAIGPNERRCFSVPGVIGWGAIVNLTPILANGAGDGQLLKNDDSITPPVGANVNYGPGTVNPNVAIAEVGFSAADPVCFINSKHASVHLVADAFGSIAPSDITMADPSNGSMKRALDTRTAAGGGKIGPSGRRCFAVSGNPGDAAIINLTPVLADGFGDGQVVSSDVVDPPKAANVNFGPSTVDPNLTIATIGADGQVCYVNSKHSSVHLIADHMATIAAASYTPAQPNGAPMRVLDTRKNDPVTDPTTIPPDTTPTSSVPPTDPPTTASPTTVPPDECDPSYPTVCIPPPPPDLDCGDITYTNFVVLPPDPHNFDRDGNGIGCES